MISLQLITSNPQITKIACSSFQRVLTTANLICWKNEIEPIFRLGRSHYSEHFSKKTYYSLNADFLICAAANSQCESCSASVFVNPSIIAMRNPDHLWPESYDRTPNVQYSEDRKERIGHSAFAILLTDEELEVHGHRFVSSPGIFSIQSGYLSRLIEVWAEAQELGKNLDESIREKAVWNKTLVMLAGEMTQKPFERGEIIPVREGEIDWDEVRNACIVSVSDWKDEKAKQHFLRCLYFGHFFGDESGLMLNILDP